MILSAAICLSGTTRIAAALEPLDFKRIEHAPPAGYTIWKSNCMTGFGQFWSDPANADFGPLLGYHQNRLVVETYLLNADDVSARKDFSDLKIIQGAQVNHVTMDYVHGGFNRGKGPVYMINFHFVDPSTKQTICPPPGRPGLG
jgi:hypothetical protein